MNKELQDLAWACLPKETREEIRQIHFHFSNTVNKTVVSEFENIFGRDNITSNTAPEEMLIKSRAKVIDLYARAENEVSFGSEDLQLWGKHCIEILDSLFGDKSQPDKEEPPLKITAAESLIEMAKDEMGISEEQPSVQVEPKQFFESDYRIGDKVIIEISSIGKARKEVVTLIQQYQPQCEYNDYTKTWVVQTQGGMKYQSEEERFEPYTEPETPNLSQSTSNCDKSEYNKLKDNMEEKELNLCELLKGCEGEIFSSPEDGNVTILKVSSEEILAENDKGLRLNFHGGLLTTSLTGFAYLYPSRALYEKYPLDAKKAWQVWASERQPKRWRAKRNEKYWYLDRRFIPKKCIAGPNEIFDDTNYKNGNYFRTEEEAQQAAEVIKKALLDFHKKNAEK